MSKYKETFLLDSTSVRVCMYTYVTGLRYLDEIRGNEVTKILAREKNILTRG